MSMLSAQSDELRKKAEELRHVHADDASAGLLFAAMGAMREAADTIENLRDRLQESERHNRINLEVMGEMHHPEIVDLMQECHATQANYEHCKYSTNRGWRDTSRYSELFGTPERAARTLHSFCKDCFCGDCSTCGLPDWADYRHDYDALLEWLRGDA